MNISWRSRPGRRAHPRRRLRPDGAGLYAKQRAQRVETASAPVRFSFGIASPHKGCVAPQTLPKHRKSVLFGPVRRPAGAMSFQEGSAADDVSCEVQALVASTPQLRSEVDAEFRRYYSTLCTVCAYKTWIIFLYTTCTRVECRRHHCRECARRFLTLSLEVQALVPQTPLVTLGV